MVRRLSGLRRAGLVAGLTLGIVGLGRPAFATDDGYQNVFTSVLGAVGVLPPEKTPDIDYRERPPLVLPPKPTLAKPQEAGLTRPTSWPADPDVARRRKEAQQAKIPVVSLFNHGDDERMSKAEQLKYRAEETPAEPIDDAYRCKLSERSMSHCRVDPDEMKAESERFKKMNPDAKSDALTAGVEPDRLYLTQPPKGYMKSTKTVAATREAPRPARDDSSPLSTYIHTDTTKIDPLDR